jgi:3-carboxy-cis,cis-muconate cycloisomerase
VSMALAAKIGKHDAHALIEAASRKAISDQTHLREVLSADVRVTAHLSTDEIARLFDPMSYQGAAPELIDRLLASAQSRAKP